MEAAPSTNGHNGRLPNGRFASGNPGGPGNPHAAAVAGWRAALVNAVSADDVQHVMAALVAKARAGEAWAVRELLDRCLGRPQQKMELAASNLQTWQEMLACLPPLQPSEQR